jgi:hypothetical protein
MKRRNFLAGSAALGTMVSPLAAFSSSRDQSESGQEYIEWIRYRISNRSVMSEVRDFYKEVAIPALNRMGLDRIGFFTVTHGENGPYYYVMVPHPDLSSVMSYKAQLMNDETYLKEGKAFLEAPLSDPSYARIDSTLFKAFKNIPKVEVRKDLVGQKHMMELRIYESHSYVYGQKKIHMFNEGGEIEIFRKTGLTPVFFGEAMVGQAIPNLTYMLVFEDNKEREKAWDQFRIHPDWKKLSSDPYYKDTVSNITDLILNPATFSQV